MIKESEFVWKEHKVNNIETNPLDEIYCIVDVGSCAKKYSIKYQMEDGSRSANSSDEKAKYYILFETHGQKATVQDKEDFFYKLSNVDGYVFGHETFIKVFEDLDEAKHQGYKQYSCIYGGVLHYFTENIDKATKDHFVV